MKRQAGSGTFYHAHNAQANEAESLKVSILIVFILA